MKKNSVVYIAQYHGTSLISRLIRWRTWSDISHTAAYLPGDQTMIEAWPAKVRRQHWTKGHTPGTRIELFKVPCSREQRDRFYAFLKAEIGKKYDYSAILGFVTRARSEDSDKWFCSELIFAAAQHAGINLLKRVEPHKVSPGLLNVSPKLDYFRTMFVPSGRKKEPVDTVGVDGSDNENSAWE